MEGRWATGCGGRGGRRAKALQAISRKLVVPCLEATPEVTLDVDATEVIAEKQEAHWTYHQVQGYMPLVGYVDGVCVGDEFREGNANPVAGILAFAPEL